MRLAKVALLLGLVLAARPSTAEEWFDAYGRGLDALKARRAERAIESFERAIRMRPEPGANLITYGTNRLDRYHPYLRLAEAYLMANHLEKAQEALRRSAQRGKEPADERSRLEATVSDAAIERARAAAAAAPPTTVAAAPPTTVAPPVTVAQAPPTTTAPVPSTLPPSPLATPALGPREVKASPRVPERPVVVPAASAPPETVAPAPPASTPPALAALVITSDPPGAAVYLDDEPLGATDPASGRLVKSGIAPGPHRLRLTHPRRSELVQEVVVGTAGPTQVRAQLPAEPASALSPLALGGIAILLVALAAAVLLWKRRAVAVEGPGATVALPTHGETVTRASTPPRPTPRPQATLGAARATVVPPATETPLESLVGSQETAFIPPAPAVSTSGRFGDYTLHEQLGKGGMASVYKAERRGEVCALKRPLAAFLEDPEFRERFLREAEIGRTLHHPNIIRIFERGAVDRVPYFTMELVQGETLQAHVRRQGALPPGEAARIIVQVAEALDYAHLKGVVHRDLKPSNIMILADGDVKVMDYGIARARRFDGLTVTGAFLGTPDYVAPETAEGRGTDARSDLYSLGIVFYEILTGQKPFVGDTPFATLRKHCSEPPTPPSLIAPGTPRELEAIILRLLAKDPAQRHPGAEELLIELRDYLNRAV